MGVGLWTCRRCTTAFAVGLPYCPHCTGTDIDRDEDGMAKNTVHGGPSDVDAVPGQPGYQAPAEAEEATTGAFIEEATEPNGPTVAELRGLLRTRGLPTSGTKDELRERLAQAELNEPED